MTVALRKLIDLIYPPRCIACPAETELAGGLCADCWAGTEFISGPVCAQCGAPVDGADKPDDLRCDDCTRHPPDWHRGRAALVYSAIGRRIVLQLKHGDRLDVVPALATWLRRAGGDLIERADIVAPVPLHWSRLVKRRYNQSAELARAVAPDTAVPNLLRRTRTTPSLDGRPRHERREILDAAIDLSPHPVAGQTILLIDDVLTTGATLSACARALTEAGAAEVNVLTLARVVRDAPMPISSKAQED